MSTPTRLRLEVLESRRTPATLGTDGKTVTFTDKDGDAATVTFSKAVLTADNVNAVFTFDSGVGAVNGSNATPEQLQTIDLTTLPAGLSVTATATAAGGGDGKVNVGFVNAGGKDEGTVSISGDLGRVVAGDAKVTTPGLKALVVGSIGVQGTATQAAGGSLTSTITGPLGKLTVTGDVRGAAINVTGGMTGANGKIGSIGIGGSLLADAVTPFTGIVTATGNIGKVTITGDVTGHGANSGAVVSYAGSIGSVSIGGYVTGTGNYSGGIYAGTTIGKVTITHDLTGGAGTRSGAITAVAGIKSVAIGGNVTGSTGASSGSIVSGRGNIGPVTIGGDLTGGTGNYSGAVQAYYATVGTRKVGGKLGTVTVTGNVFGGAGRYSGAVYAQLGIGAVSLGSLSGGGGYASGIVATNNGNIKSVTVHGDVNGGGGNYSGEIFAGKTGNLGPVAILGNGGNQHGDVTGGSGKFSAIIRGAKITSVTIAGNVTGGPGPGSASIEALGNLGQVKVAGNWIGASIAAGVTPGADGFFGTADDVRVKATIAGITIGGTVSGTVAPGDTFAFVADHIVKASIGGQALALKPGAENDSINLDPNNNDFTLEELAPT
jgi:hypothetical protein